MGSPLVEHVASLLSGTRRCRARRRLFAATSLDAGGLLLGARPGRPGHRGHASWPASATSPTTGSGSSRSSGRSRGRSPRAGSSPSMARRGSRRRCSAAACISGSGGGSTASTRCRWSRCRRARSATSTPATARPCRRARRWARSIACNNFQDARRFLGGEPTSPEQEPVVGQRGRQRAILREGVYAINLALFTVITEDTVYRLEAGGSKELKALVNWQNELNQIDGFSPVIIGGPVEAPDPLNPGQDDAWSTASAS